jgi:ribosome-associated protein
MSVTTPLTPTPRELAIHAARKMRDKGAEDLQLLHLPAGRRGLYEYVVIGCGRSERQVATLASEVYHFCKRHGVPHFPVEGEGGWRLVDCHEVVAHALLPDLRERYRLEALWAGAEALDIEALLPTLADPDAAVARG